VAQASPLLGQLRAAYRHRAEHVAQLDTRRAALPRRYSRSTGRSGAVVNAQREAILLIRDRGVIDDVLRTIERKLDLEEVRMDAYRETSPRPSRPSLQERLRPTGLTRRVGYKLGDMR
jgi:hypothetical protein